LAIAAVLLGIAAWRRGIASARDGGILIALGAVLCLNAVLAPRVLPVTANVVLFAGALGLVALGQREGRQSLGVWGILLFVTGVLARYFEYLWDKLEGAYAFLATGILLMAAAYVFENRRRALAARTRGVAS
jgi:uncharacterized membrane protein